MIWSSDCCDCIIEMENVDIFVSWIQKCMLHSLLDNQRLLNEVLVHNRSFKIIDAPTPSERDQNNTDKRNERIRIRAIGDPIRNV